MKELISIIVPVYNVEEYVEECIKSIIDQTYKNIEIIIINDGSTDNSVAICRKLASEDKRIKLINQKNKGLSAARNKGIDVANGKYITFIDSDDYILEKYIECLYNAIKINKTNVAQCGILRVDSGNRIIQNFHYKNNEILKGKEILKDVSGVHLMENTIVWNKMYEKKLFSNVRFPIGKIHEDEFTTYKIFYKANNIAIINEDLYVYRKREDSITEKKYNLKRLDKIIAFKEKTEFFKNKNETELYLIFLKQYLEELRINYVKVKKYIKFSENATRDILEKYNKAYKEYICKKNTTIKSRIVATLFYLFPNLFYYAKKNSFG